MKNPVFKFKQFVVAQDKCAMKVNTDGVLLAVWSARKIAKQPAGEEPLRLLDVGTGTGVIAMIMAQNFTRPVIDAIDIDAGACLQAKENFENSIWATRLNAIQVSLQDYRPLHQYEVIVSNPPYFVDDYKTGNAERDLARHGTALTFTDLMQGVARLLLPKGKAFIAIPVFNVGVLEPLAKAEGLHITGLAEVIAVQGKNSYLVLLQLERERSSYEKESITIQGKTGEFTQPYRELTKEYYLKF